MRSGGECAQSLCDMPSLLWAAKPFMQRYGFETNEAWETRPSGLECISCKLAEIKRSRPYTDARLQKIS